SPCSPTASNATGNAKPELAKGQYQSGIPQRQLGDCSSPTYKAFPTVRFARQRAGGLSWTIELEYIQFTSGALRATLPRRPSLCRLDFNEPPTSVGGILLR